MVEDHAQYHVRHLLWLYHPMLNICTTIKLTKYDFLTANRAHNREISIANETDLLQVIKFAATIVRSGNQH